MFALLETFLLKGENYIGRSASRAALHQNPILSMAKSHENGVLSVSSIPAGSKLWVLGNLTCSIRDERTSTGA